MTHPNFAVLWSNALVGTYNDLPSALSAIELGGGNVYERFGNGARASEKLAEIVAVCRRHASPASNAGAHALAVKCLELAGERDSGGNETTDYFLTRVRVREREGGRGFE